MKKIIISFLLLSITTTSFSQQTDPASALTKQEYLQKSKKQKTTAWILLGSGIALGASGAVWAGSDWDATGPDVLLVAGGASLIGSIPFFISSGKNKRRAMSISYKMQRVSQIQNTGLVKQPVPSVILKIGI